LPFERRYWKDVEMHLNLSRTFNCGFSEGRKRKLKYALLGKDEGRFGDDSNSRNWTQPDGGELP
jgi:hypothetical protein